MARRSGRRPGDSGTREAIRSAATRQFAELGYDRTSLRSIAAEAGVDPALVSHFFGSKQKLFVEVVELPFDPAKVVPRVFGGALEQAGERVARFLMAVLEDPHARQPMVGLVRAAASEPEAARLVRDLMTREVYARIVETLGVDDADLRASLLASQVVGLVMARYVVCVEPLASMPAETLAAAIAPNLQRYLAEPLPDAVRGVSLRRSYARDGNLRRPLMRVLIVEDERRLADAIARGLRHRAMAVDTAYEGGGALRKVDLVEYDVVVLDRDLPGLHGDEVCQTLRAEHSGPAVLMLTASGQLDEIVEGLALGADDYLAKPFAFEELLARVQALGRRPRRSLPPVLVRNDVELDPARHEVLRDGEPVILQRKEFGVLRVLLEADGGVVSSEELLRRVWDENVDPFTNAVRVVVMTLRRKLGDPPLIETVTGAGYRIR